MGEQTRILIVDDSKTIRESLCRDLSRFGFACTMAADGLEALETMAKAEFDVALIDLKMPRMDGIALLCAIEERGIDTVPVILSGTGQISEAVEAIKHGAFEFLEKPTVIDVVRRTIEWALMHRKIVQHARAMSRLAGQWEATFDASPDMTIVTSPTHRIRRVNRAVAERLGRAKEQVIGRDCHAALCGDDHPASACPFTGDLDEQRARSAEFVQEVWAGDFEIMSTALRDDREELTGWMHVVRDITERKRAERELAKIHAENALMVASIPSILICLDTRGMVTQWNLAAEAAFGISDVSAVGSPLDECRIDWEFDIIREALQKCVSTGLPTRVDDIRFTGTDGKNRFLGVTMSPMKDGRSEHQGVFMLGADITERRMLESRPAQAQKLESIGQ